MRPEVGRVATSKTPSPGGQRAVGAQSKPNPRPHAMSLVWFFSLGGLGVFFPFYSMYLSENAGLSGSQIGVVLAAIPAVGLIAQPLWGIVADRTGLRARLLALLCFGAGALYAALFFAQGFAAILLTTAALAVFASALVPTAVAVTLALTSTTGPNTFGHIRVWGTVGFLALVVGFPQFLDAFDFNAGARGSSTGASQPGLGIMFLVTGAMVAIAGLVALALPRSAELSLRAERGDWRQILHHGPYLRLLAFSLLGYLCLQGPMGMFALYVRAHGGTAESVSWMWIAMLVVEIPLVAMSGRTLERVGPRGLLAIGVIAGGLRWTVCGFASDLGWVYVVSLLHGVTVAGLIVGAPLYVEAVVPERLRSTGQGILAMVGLSMGGISSNLATGWLIDHVGPDAPYIAGGAGALLLGVLVPWFLPAPRHLEPVVEVPTDRPDKSPDPGS
jgi:PPP family 3-phenylpropionic acid transporter